MCSLIIDRPDKCHTIGHFSRRHAFAELEGGGRKKKGEDGEENALSPEENPQHGMYCVRMWLNRQGEDHHGLDRLVVVESPFSFNDKM